MPYGPDDRLQEIISILVTEADANAIVQLALLGPTAIPHLIPYLEREEARERPTTTPAQANAITRAMGMIADETAATALVTRFKRVQGKNPYERGPSDEFRVTANALKKIGSSAALDAIIARLHEFEPEHAATTLAAFGEPGMLEVVAMLQERTGAELAFAIELVKRWKREDCLSPLVGLLSSSDPKDAAAAAVALGHFRGVPRAPLVSRFAALAEEFAGGYTEKRDEGMADRERLYRAVLAALYHSQDVSVVADLLGPAAMERKRSKERSRYYGTGDVVRNACVSMGTPALAYLEGKAIEGQPDEVRAVATEIAHRIREGEAGEKPALDSDRNRGWVR